LIPLVAKKEKRGWFSSTEKDPLDMSLPKHLELQGHEVARLGQRVRQLFGDGKYEEALRSAEERLRIAAATYGEEHAMTATCLNDVGTFEQVFGRFDRAEELFEKASKVQRKLLGDCHPHSVATLQNLAALYAAKGDKAKGEAMQMLVQALQQSGQLPPPQGHAQGT